MKTLKELKEAQAVIALYQAKVDAILENDPIAEVDEETQMALQVAYEMMCYIMDHKCGAAKFVSGKIEAMRKELIEDGVDIENAIAFADMKEKQDQAKWN